MTQEFKYQVGDTLVHRSMLVPPTPLAVIRLFVLERHVSEVGNGHQKISYVCRPSAVSRCGAESMLASDVVAYDECEVTHYSEYLQMGTLQHPRAESMELYQQQIDDLYATLYEMKAKATPPNPT